MFRVSKNERKSQTKSHKSVRYKRKITNNWQNPEDIFFLNWQNPKDISLKVTKPWRYFFYPRMYKNAKKGHSVRFLNKFLIHPKK